MTGVHSFLFAKGGGMKIKQLLDKYRGPENAPGQGDEARQEPVDVNPDPGAGEFAGPERASSAHIHEGMPDQINIEVGVSARLPLDLLPDQAVKDLCRQYRFKNPAWAKAVRYSLHPPEKYLYAYYVDEANRFCVPRASLRRLVNFLQVRKTGVHIDDKTVSVPVSSGFSFIGEKQPLCMEAYRALYNKRFNVLGATGAAAYEVVCLLMAARAQKTLVVVKSKHQLYKWRDQLSVLTDLSAKNIGLAGDRNLDLDADVVVGIDRTLYKYQQEISAGHLVIDRCDTANIKIFYQLCWNVASKYITGIAGRKEREDGLSDLMYIFCGPLRYQLSAGPEPARRVLEIRNVSAGDASDSKEDDYLVLLDGLCGDLNRNHQVAADILAYTAQGKRCLVVSARTRHLKDISEFLSEQLRGSEIITGRTKPGAKKSAEQRFNAKEALVMMTTTKSVGALEIDPVSVAVVAAPFKYKDTAANVVHLVAGGGRIVEYLDSHPFFKSSLQKRIATYRQLGVQVAQSI